MYEYHPGKNNFDQKSTDENTFMDRLVKTLFITGLLLLATIAVIKWFGLID